MSLSLFSYVCVSVCCICIHVSDCESMCMLMECADMSESSDIVYLNVHLFLSHVYGVWMFSSSIGIKIRSPGSGPFAGGERGFSGPAK